MSITFSPIGIIHTEFEQKSGVPIQSLFGKSHYGEIELFPEYIEGLKDLSGIEHIYLLYHFNQHDQYQMVVTPYMDDTPRGLFATRAPKRPNGIGISIVEIVTIKDNVISFKGVDMLNNTPLLDIKPYVPEIDSIPGSKAGWYDNVKNKHIISDDRY